VAIRALFIKVHWVVTITISVQGYGRLVVRRTRKCSIYIYT